MIEISSHRSVRSIRMKEYRCQDRLTKNVCFVDPYIVLAIISWAFCGRIKTIDHVRSRLNKMFIRLKSVVIGQREWKKVIVEISSRKMYVSLIAIYYLPSHPWRYVEGQKQWSRLSKFYYSFSNLSNKKIFILRQIMKVCHIMLMNKKLVLTRTGCIRLISGSLFIF